MIKRLFQISVKISLKCSSCNVTVILMQCYNLSVILVIFMVFNIQVNGLLINYQRIIKIEVNLG